MPGIPSNSLRRSSASVGQSMASIRKTVVVGSLMMPLCRLYAFDYEPGYSIDSRKRSPGNGEKSRLASNWGIFAPCLCTSWGPSATLRTALTAP